MSGSFDDFFDFDHDGKLGAFERSVQMEYWDKLSGDSDSTGALSTPRPAQPARPANPPAGKRAGAKRAGAEMPGAKKSGPEKAAAKSDPSVWIVPALAAIVLCCIIGYRSYRAIKVNFDKRAAMKQLEAHLEDYKEKVATDYAKLCAKQITDPPGTFTAEGLATIEPLYTYKKHDYYEVNVNYKVTLHLDRSFDKLTDRSKYTALVELLPKIEVLYDYFLDENFPEFQDLIDNELVEGLTVDYRKDRHHDLFIETPKHLYQYSYMYDDLFIMDGESVFVMDEKSKWNRKRSESGSGYGAGSGAGARGGSGSSGYSGYSYTDADDYADEHYEDYMEEGYDYDDAYDAAYDDWDE